MANMFSTLFFGICNTVVVFFQTMISQEATEKYVRGARIDGGGGGGGRGGVGGGYTPSRHVRVAGGG